MWEVLGNPAWLMCLTYHPKSLDHCAVRSIAGITGRGPVDLLFGESIAMFHVLSIKGKKKSLKFLYYFCLLKVRIVVIVYFFFLYITCL